MVTGPQRAGTRICAQMIAFDTGYRFVDELDFKVNHFPKFINMFSCENVVVQAPGLSHRAVSVSKFKNSLIVFMRRDVKDIVASQKRISWIGKEVEYGNYGLPATHPIEVSQVKYNFWDNFQKRDIDDYLEIDYNSLSKHPFWVPKKFREDFGPFQTKTFNPKMNIKFL